MRRSRRMRGGEPRSNASMWNGGRRHRRGKSLKKKRSSRKGGNLVGNALLPFGLLWAQKSYQGNRRKSRKHRRTRRRR